MLILQNNLHRLNFDFAPIQLTFEGGGAIIDSGLTGQAAAPGAGLPDDEDALDSEWWSTRRCWESAAVWFAFPSPSAVPGNVVVIGGSVGGCDDEESVVDDVPDAVDDNVAAAAAADDDDVAGRVDGAVFGNRGTSSWGKEGSKLGKGGASKSGNNNPDSASLSITSSSSISSSENVSTVELKERSLQRR